VRVDADVDYFLTRWVLRLEPADAVKHDGLAARGVKQDEAGVIGRDSHGGPGPVIAEESHLAGAANSTYSRAPIPGGSIEVERTALLVGRPHCGVRNLLAAP